MMFCRPVLTVLPFRGVCLGMRGSSPGRMTSGVGREAPRHWEQSCNRVNDNSKKNMNENKRKTDRRKEDQNEIILKHLRRSTQGSGGNSVSPMSHHMYSNCIADIKPLTSHQFYNFTHIQARGLKS